VVNCLELDGTIYLHSRETVFVESVFNFLYYKSVIIGEIGVVSELRLVQAQLSHYELL